MVGETQKLMPFKSALASDSCPASLKDKTASYRGVPKSQAFRSPSTFAKN